MSHHGIMPSKRGKNYTMASAIGLRVYRITVNKRGDKTRLPLDCDDLSTSVPEFITDFISNHSNPTQDEEMERSWYFENRNDDGLGSSQGYVHYGTFGFESNLIDTKTKKKNYRRKATDAEEIPLFYEFWCPEEESFGFAAFQSFQVRSCIRLVMKRMKDVFEARNPAFVLVFKKLLPGDAAGSAYFSADVRQLRLIKRKAPSDVAERYFNRHSPEPIDLEVVMSARRRGSLGPFSALLNKVKSGERNVITHDGIEFPEAVAEIRVGKRTRKVGVLGFNGEAGVIDLTDVIVKGPDGHPTFESLKKESDTILRDFYDTLAGGVE